MVRVRDVEKYYGDFQALRGVSLNVHEGEVVVICVPSGSGKSTLLRCINRLEPWDGGEVRVSGRQLGFHEDGNSRSPRALE